MRVALLVNYVGADLDANLACILALADEACDAGAQVIVFPEAALTGLINDDNPAHDLQLSQPIPGSFTDRLSILSRTRQVWIVCGLLERDGGRLYDTAVMIDTNGSLVLKYRRIQPQWHGRNADPSVYCQGTSVPVVATPFGTMACIICGDLFDDGVIERVRAHQPEWLLIPFTRCFNDASWDQARWDDDEMPSYCQRIAMMSCTTFMVNYLADRELNDGSFGGAEVISGDGRRLVNYPLGSSGIFIYDAGR